MAIVELVADLRGVAARCAVCTGPLLDTPAVLLTALEFLGLLWAMAAAGPPAELLTATGSLGVLGPMAAEVQLELALLRPTKPLLLLPLTTSLLLVLLTLPDVRSGDRVPGDRVLCIAETVKSE